MVFNDFHITPAMPDEVAELYGGQKAPCLLFFTQASRAEPWGAASKAAACRHAQGASTYRLRRPPGKDARELTLPLPHCPHPSRLNNPSALIHPPQTG